MVVLELVLGIVVGPEVLDLAQSDDFTEFFGNLGLGMLFFFAGYEIDFGRIRGRPLPLAAIGWVMSLALAYSIGGALAAAGIVRRSQRSHCRLQPRPERPGITPPAPARRAFARNAMGQSDGLLGVCGDLTQMA